MNLRKGVANSAQNTIFLSLFNLPLLQGSKSPRLPTHRSNGRIVYSRSYGSMANGQHLSLVVIINPRRIREGYGSHSVCLSVTKLAAIYLVYKSKLQCYMIPYGIPNACIVWIPLKTLCSPVLASFADSKLLDFP